MQYYDFERLLMNVSLDEVSIKLTVSRVVSGELQSIDITINLNASAFSELV